jgi:hypothetical protein
MVLPVRIELTTSALPRMRSTTELRQHVSGEGPRLWPPRAQTVKEKGMDAKEKAERLAAALRANLKRRKAQARLQKPVGPKPPQE